MLVLIAIVFAQVAAATPPRPGPTGSVSTPARTCKLLQIAYRMDKGRADAIYPTAIGASPDDFGNLRNFNAAYRAHMGLREGEFEDLVANEESALRPGFVPHCAWKGQAIAPTQDGDRTLVTYFRQPILSSDRRLALVEVSHRNGFSGWGNLCILRRSKGTWSGRCIPAYTIR